MQPICLNLLKVKENLKKTYYIAILENQRGGLWDWGVKGLLRLMDVDYKES